jgi:saccharopine dehydrogenase-like NADP-dependent oxidoreductase
MLIQILIAGAGKSANHLIDYFLKESIQQNWFITVADGDAKTLTEKVGSHPNALAIVLDISSSKDRQALVKQADIVVSLMPPHLHILLAEDCLQFGKHLITSSYISPELKELNTAAKEAGLMFMCEMGLDPGIDHMSASMLIHDINRVASDIVYFKSYCGGLIAPVSDNNPWHYKFTWNPINIINAGKSGATYLEHGNEIHVQYADIFKNAASLSIDQLGEFVYYPNRDSLDYIDTYQVQGVDTFMRATIRNKEFCIGWHALIKLGLTDSAIEYRSNGLSHASLIKLITNYTDTNISIVEYVAQLLGISLNSDLMKMLHYLDLFSEVDFIDIEKTTAADFLFKILLKKWDMNENDQDMVIMQHDIIYKHKQKLHSISSTLVAYGENKHFSAMSKTVGMPMAILTKLILTKQISSLPSGVLIPTMQQIYKPVLKELAKHQIVFTEKIN